MCTGKTWRAAIVVLGTFGLIAFLGGCQAFLPVEEPTVDSEQTVSGLAAQIEGVDYVCVDRAPDVANPPPLRSGVERLNLPALCPLGKVPQFLVNTTSWIKGPPPQQDQVVASAVTCYFGACYDYGTSRQVVTNKGLSARLTVHSPAIDSIDGAHSLAELAAIDRRTSGDNIAEVGWIKNIGDVTRVFVFWWKDGVGQGYNCCGWVPYDNTIQPGAPISNDTVGKFFTIEYSQGNWWIQYAGIWMGYYPGSLWSGQFTQGDETQYFGEVASYDTTGKTTTDMGNGLWASNTSAAKMTSQTYKNTSGTWVSASTSKSATSPERYTVYSLSATGMRYGGPGCTSNC